MLREKSKYWIGKSRKRNYENALNEGADFTSALNDLAKGREFYEKQAEGIGSYFFDSVFADIDSLSLFGGIHRKVFGYHRLLAHRFPFAIYYK